MDMGFEEILLCEQEWLFHERREDSPWDEAPLISTKVRHRRMLRMISGT